MAHALKRRETRRLDVSPRPASIRTLDYRRPTDVMNRIRGEFAEMRGFSPTLAQAARLFDLLPEECHCLLSRLEDEGFLRRTADGRYRLPA